MALPTPVDSFTGANGTALTTYSANYSLNQGNFQIETNALAANGASSTAESGARWNADSFPNDQYAQATLGSLAAVLNAYIGIGVRFDTGGAATYYGAYYSDDASEILIFKMVAGVFTQLGAAVAGARVAGNVLRLEVSGSTLTLKINGVINTTRSDSAITSGSGGMVGRGLTTGHTIDSWSAGALTTATPSATGTRRVGNQNGPFDQRGFLKAFKWDYTIVTPSGTTIIVRRTLNPFGNHSGGRQGGQ